MVHDELHVEDVELPPSEPSFLLGGRGESAWAKSCDNAEELGTLDGSCAEEDEITRRGLGPGFLRAEVKFTVNIVLTRSVIS